ncbi:MAG: hypothetical protein LBE49_02840, partial [Deltaproteobacteria bacterium]|nr:hypothetical protein [Deltaproteobacteria bacterium]
MTPVSRFQPIEPQSPALSFPDREAESRFPVRLTEREFEGAVPWSSRLVEPISPSKYPELKAGELLTARHKGSFIRPCPATPRYNCCGLNIIHIGQGC